MPRARHRQGFPCCCAFHLPCMPTPLPRRTPASALVALFPASRRPSPISRRVGFRVIRFEACSAFTRVPACMVAEPPVAALLPECFSPCRYLHEPPWPLPAGATVAGWDSHPPGKHAFPRRTVKCRLHRHSPWTGHEHALTAHPLLSAVQTQPHLLRHGGPEPRQRIDKDPEGRASYHTAQRMQHPPLQPPKNLE